MGSLGRLGCLAEFNVKVESRRGARRPAPVLNLERSISQLQVGKDMSIDPNLLPMSNIKYTLVKA